MNREDVMRMAMRAGLLDRVDCSNDYFIPADAFIDEMEKLANLAYEAGRKDKQEWQNTADKCELEPVPAKGTLLPAQPEPKPVAWYYAGSSVEPESVELDCDLFNAQKAKCTPLYIAQQQREWQGLTDADIAQTMHGSVEGSNMLPYQFARAIEAKLKEKNS